MRKKLFSLRAKLTFAFILISLISVMLVAILIQQFVANEFDRYVLEQSRETFVENALDYYVANGTLAGFDVDQRPPQVNQNPQDNNNRNDNNNDGNDDRRPPQQQVSVVPFVLADADRRIMIPGTDFRPGQRLPDREYNQSEAIELDGEIIGYIFTPNVDLRRSAEEQAYIERTTRALIAAAIGGVLIAGLLGILSAGIYTRPLQELTTALQKVGKGDFNQQVPVRSQDELGILAGQFNQMNNDLAHANQLRRQMTADIAHELRTPLTVITGYMESLWEGVLKPTPERFEALYNESQLLQRLVEDLRTLSLADAGELPLNLQPTSPHELLDRLQESYVHRANQAHIQLAADAPNTLPPVKMDVERMAQVLGNLVHNALRHTPAGGSVRLLAEQVGRQIHLQVRDSGEGIPPEMLPNVFERFYRGDAARQQAEGETGLGLAIARSIVEAHGGRIKVDSVLNEGTTFSILLPL